MTTLTLERASVAPPRAAHEMPRELDLHEIGGLLDGSLRVADVPAISARLAAMSAEERGRLPCIGNERADLVALVEGAGFAVLRDFGRGQVVGPVIAQDPQIAQRLISFLLAGKAGRFIRVDTPQDIGADDQVSGWLQQIGLARVDTGIAMRRGTLPAPTAKNFQRFALAAQALG